MSRTISSSVTFDKWRIPFFLNIFTLLIISLPKFKWCATSSMSSFGPFDTSAPRPSIEIQLEVSFRPLSAPFAVSLYLCKSYASVKMYGNGVFGGWPRPVSSFPSFPIVPPTVPLTNLFKSGRNWVSNRTACSVYDCLAMNQVFSNLLICGKVNPRITPANPIRTENSLTIKLTQVLRSMEDFYHHLCHQGHLIL